MRYVLVAVAIALVGCSHTHQPVSPTVATARARDIGSVRGRYMLGDRPVSAMRLGLFPRRWINGQQQRMADSALTDADGRFEFPEIQPGKYAIFRIGRDSFGVTVADGAPLTWVDVGAGTDEIITIGGNGWRVMGRVALPKSLAARLKSIRAELSRDITEPDWPVPADVQHASAELYAEWRKAFLASDAGRRWERAELAVYQEPEEYDAGVSSDGVFQFDGVPPGKYWVQILGTSDADHGTWLGLISTMANVPAAPAGQADAVLHVPPIVVKPTLDEPATAPAGATVTVRVTDKQGKPLAGAEIIVSRRVGNIGGVTDAQGRCVIDQGIAPGDSICVSLDGYRIDEKPARAGAKQIDFVLEHLPVIHGKVLDAVTGRPIPRFDCMLVGDMGDGNPGTRFEPTLFADGSYEIRLDPQLEESKPWRVRIEASGYLPKESPALSRDAEQDFSLTPAPDITGRVLGPDGKPAAGVTVWAATPRRNAVLQSYADARPSAHVAVTDANGRFDLWPEQGRFVIAAAGDAGYAIVPQADFAFGKDIHLTAWGSIQGEAQFAGKPGAGQIINVSTPGWPFAHPGDIEQLSVFHDCSTVTDARGEYHIHHVPAGLMSVAWSNDIDNGSISIEGDGQETEIVRVSAGRQITVNFGDHGPVTRPVVGSVRLDPRAAGWTLDGGTVIARTLQSSIKYSAPGWSCIRQVRLDPRGTFQMGGLLPGRYQLVVQPELSKSGVYEYELHDGILEFSVPDISDALRDKPLKLPVVELNPPAPNPATQPRNDKPRGLYPTPP